MNLTTHEKLDLAVFLINAEMNTRIGDVQYNKERIKDLIKKITNELLSSIKFDITKLENDLRKSNNEVKALTDLLEDNAYYD